MSVNFDKAYADAESIFRAGLFRVDPASMIASTVSVEPAPHPVLVVRTEIQEERVDLSRFDRIVVTGMGKASARMALGLESVLGDRISGGVVAVKTGHVETLARITLVEAAHPVPDESSVAAARAVLGVCGSPDERTLVIVLISGGGSAILCAPAEGISLADKAAATQLLLASGAAIHEVNCVRKHLSSIKGGRLAAAYAPATVLSLILSDVSGDDLDSIASGPTVPDPTTFADALGIARRYGIVDALPASVADRLIRGAAGEIPDTPKLGDPAFDRATTILLGSNRLALMAARARAEALGYSTLALTARLSGEAREAALMYLAVGKDVAASGFPLARPACFLAGGETTVTLRGKGLGGRNQEMALAFLDAMERFPKDAGDLVFLAASTDGNDGPTDAAGAFASAEIVARAAAAGIKAADYLAANDSWHFFDRLGCLLRTGPTNTNVCDIQVLLVP